MNHFWSLKEKSTANRTVATDQECGSMRPKSKRAWALGAMAPGVVAAVVAFFPALALASVEGSLLAVQAKLVGTILPLAAICGLVIAGFSFVAGHPNARSHLTLAIMGAVVGFGAESIVALIRSLIQ